MTARAYRSKKAKGKKLESKVAERYRHHKVDDTARPMPLSGAMSHFKSDIYKRFDVDWIDEVKNHETVRLSQFWNQASVQAGLRNPVLHVSSNFRPIITIIRECDFDALVGDDMRRFDVLDITRKRRFKFWDYASQCSGFTPTATVVYITTADESLVMMAVDVYMTLRSENIGLK